MDRINWLREMRRDCEEQYDRESLLYDQEGGVYSNIAHQQFIQEFLRFIPQNSSILDAPCGTGRYLPFIVEKGHSILGIDQSQGMLARARAKFPNFQFEKVGLQEMAFQARFDGAICMDAMENIPPKIGLLSSATSTGPLNNTAIFISPLKQLKMLTRTRSSKLMNGRNRLGYRLYMESGQTKKFIIIIQPINRSENGFTSQDLKFSKKGMAKYGTTTSWYERCRLIQHDKQHLTMPRDSQREQWSKVISLSLTGMLIGLSCYPNLVESFLH
jgi:SAM-dependent methyltransferase